MLKEILNIINIVDILIIAVFIRIIWIAVIKGVMVEFFKLFAVFITCFVALHYFNQLAGVLKGFLTLPVSLIEILAVVILWAFITILFRFMREGWLASINPEGKVALSQRIAGGALALPRAVLVSGLIFFLIFVSGNVYLNKKARQAWSGFYFRDKALRVYMLVYSQIVSRLFTGEEINMELEKVPERYKKKTSKKIDPY